MPTTRPSTAFVDGECSACITHRNRPTIDWKQRENELCRILEQAPKNGSGFDVIVPSSGGKDSTAQTIKMIELGAKPLVVTATTCHLTPIGRRNIDNLARFAETVEFTPNQTVRRKLNVLATELVGDCSHAEHMAIFSVPFRAAAQFGIQTIIFGENPQAEYGGPLGSEEALTMTARWRSEHGGFLGMRPSDFIGMDGITESDMAYYELPPSEEMEKVSAYFLGMFMPWNSRQNISVSMSYGMAVTPSHPSSLYIGENMDNAQTGLHDFFGYIKYGYGRLCAQISTDVRNGLVSRKTALEMVEDRDGLFPNDYAGVPLDDVLIRLGKSRSWLDAQIQKHTNGALFSRVIGGRPILKEFDTVEAAE